jgi:hypothetical protein
MLSNPEIMFEYTSYGKDLVKSFDPHASIGEVWRYLSGPAFA